MSHADMTGNITIFDEFLARSLITKFGDLQADKIGIPKLSKSMKLMDNGTVAYNYNGKQVYFTCQNAAGLQEITAITYENFEKEQYKHLDVKNKIVIDIGANIGDTAIYFALRGAKHVYAFEPYPYTYNKAANNIKLNGLEKRITILNEGLGAKADTVRLNKGIAKGGTKLKESSTGKPIKITTIAEVLERFDIKAAQMKIDCEGYEYEILLNARTEDLLHFGQISIEYHYGYINLKRKLESIGFKTEHTIPRVVFYDKQMRLGLLIATR